MPGPKYFFTTASRPPSIDPFELVGETHALTAFWSSIDP